MWFFSSFHFSGRDRVFCGSVTPFAPFFSNFVKGGGDHIRFFGIQNGGIDSVDCRTFFSGCMRPDGSSAVWEIRPSFWFRLSVENARLFFWKAACSFWKVIFSERLFVFRIFSGHGFSIFFFFFLETTDFFAPNRFNKYVNVGFQF